MAQIKKELNLGARKKKRKNENRLSLYPLTEFEALDALLRVKSEKKIEMSKCEKALINARAVLSMIVHNSKIEIDLEKSAKQAIKQCDVALRARSR